MKLELVSPGKTRAAYLAEGINDYCRRLCHYVEFKIHLLKEKKGKKSARQQILAESRQLLAQTTKSSLLVALDLNGVQLSSEELAARISAWEMKGYGTVSFIIGGPSGLSPEALEKADLKISFSRMTFTHEMARLILLEQLYRAYTIKAGTKYHK